ncbi:MAG: SET domain-containing protein [Candidatus Riflebacteria bacterium]|nr:SET domain-containing protein [Candidatus Riflebacteria bacterium]
MIEITGVEVRPSLINRNGVFALRAFQVGEIVLKWDLSICIPKSEVNKVPDPERAYLHPCDEDSFIQMQMPFRYVNHSCVHNTEVREFCDIAIRYIEIGEEITSNYESDGAGQTFMCGCGSAKCRGMIGLK